MLAWDTICQPKVKGGLGLRTAGPMNDAFMAKLGWQMETRKLSLGGFVECQSQPRLFLYLAQCSEREGVG